MRKLEFSENGWSGKTADQGFLNRRGLCFRQPLCVSAPHTQSSDSRRENVSFAKCEVELCAAICEAAYARVTARYATRGGQFGKTRCGVQGNCGVVPPIAPVNQRTAAARSSLLAHQKSHSALNHSAPQCDLEDHGLPPCLVHPFYGLPRVAVLGQVWLDRDHDSFRSTYPADRRAFRRWESRLHRPPPALLDRAGAGV